MAFDPHLNFAASIVATAPSPATSGTSLVVTAGQGALFPTPPFNATVWPSGAQPTTTNAEIVRVTGISTDTLTIVRAQEGSSARAIVVGDQIANTITSKVLTDIENKGILGYTQVTSGFSTASTSPVEAGTLTVGVTIPTVFNYIKISAFARDSYNGTSNTTNTMAIFSGATPGALTTQLAAALLNVGSGSNISVSMNPVAVYKPSAGAIYYTVGIFVSAGTGYWEVGATYPAFIMVEVG